MAQVESDDNDAKQQIHGCRTVSPTDLDDLAYKSTIHGSVNIPCNHGSVMNRFFYSEFQY